MRTHKEIYINGKKSWYKFSSSFSPNKINIWNLSLLTRLTVFRNRRARGREEESGNPQKIIELLNRKVQLCSETKLKPHPTLRSFPIPKFLYNPPLLQKQKNIGHIYTQTFKGGSRRPRTSSQE